MQEAWSTPRLLPKPLNSVADDWPCWLSADGTVLLLGSTRSGGLGEQDLWLSTRKTIVDDWQEPVNLGSPINSPMTENCADLASDGRTLWFVSGIGRAGQVRKHDIWQSRRVRKTNAIPERTDPHWIVAKKILRHGGQVDVLLNGGESLSTRDIQELSPHQFAIKGVHLKETSANDECLNAVCELETIRRVKLHGPSHFTANAFAAFSKLADLDVMHCDGISINDADFAHLAKLKMLTKLFLA